MKLLCECCGTKMGSDFSGNVWCIKPACLLYNKCYSYDFIAGRSIDAECGNPVQEKELLAQGWVGHTTVETDYRYGYDKNNVDLYPELTIGTNISYIDSDGNVVYDTITDVKINHIVVGKSQWIPKHYVRLAYE